MRCRANTSMSPCCGVPTLVTPLPGARTRSKLSTTGQRTYSGSLPASLPIVDFSKLHHVLVSTSQTFRRNQTSPRRLLLRPGGRTCSRSPARQSCALRRSPTGHPLAWVPAGSTASCKHAAAARSIVSRYISTTLRRTRHTTNHTSRV